MAAQRLEDESVSESALIAIAQCGSDLDAITAEIKTFKHEITGGVHKMVRPTPEKRGGKPGATALAAMGWLSAFAVLWLWVLKLVIIDGMSITLLAFSLVVAVLASAVATGR